MDEGIMTTPIKEAIQETHPDLNEKKARVVREMEQWLGGERIPQVEGETFGFRIEDNHLELDEARALKRG